MKTVRFLTLIAVSLLTSTESYSQVKKGLPSRPNIILILADDLGYETLACNGGTSYKTPNLDQLAAKGVRFTNTYASPLCTPTRVTLMSGKYNFRNYTRFAEIDTTTYTFGNAMRAAGYKTFIAGKWQLAAEDATQSSHLPYKLGFDDYYLWQLDRKGSRYKDPVITHDNKIMPALEGKYGPDIFQSKVLSFLDENKDGPFFLYYPMVLVHAPHQPNPEQPSFPAYKVQGTNDTANFKYMMKYMDKQVGELVAKVESLGIAENTIIIFTGDNGTNKNIVSRMGNTIVHGGKGQTTIPGIHVPTIAYWKGKTPKGMVCDDMIDFTDFMPTFAEAVSFKLPKGEIFDGQSFYYRLTGGVGKPRDHIYNYYTQSGDVAKAKRYAQDKNWKLYDTGLFYNIVSDPTEEKPVNPKNLSAEVLQRHAVLEATIKKMKAQETKK